MNAVIENITLMTNQELLDLLQDYSMRLMYRNSAATQNKYYDYVKQIKQEVLKRMVNSFDDNSLDVLD